MHKPYMGNAQKGKRTRVLKKGPGRQIARSPLGRVGPGLPLAPPEAGRGAPTEVAAGEPARCGFGAVRVGALLGCLRLHLQTDRFLAAHRGDAVWEAGCVGAALALADVVERMQECELDAALTSFSAASSRSSGTLRRGLCQRAKAPDVHDFRAKNALFAPDNTKTAGRSARQPSDASEAGLDRSAR